MGETGAGILERALPTAFRDRKTAEARDNFWAFERLINPAFFRDDRDHLRELADTLQALFEGRLRAPDGSVCRRLAISEPPRFGKSYTLSLFEQWMFGRDPEQRVISVSYNETLSGRFSKGVRDGISATKLDPTDQRFRVFSDVFPGVRIKDGDAASQIWSLEGRYFNFLGAGFGGTITGVGCSVLVVDDPIKNHIEAANDRILDEQWSYYTDTLLSRVEQGGIIILVMTRWNTKDLIGRVLEAEPGKWHVLCHSACLDEAQGRMLCPSLLSYDEYRAKKRLVSPEIIQANYQNRPIDIQGRLYPGFTTYEDVPRNVRGEPDFARIVAYVDTADSGADYLCAIVAGEREGRAWVLDVLYTDAPMETTEPETAALLARHAVNHARVESNNGGRGFARNVERLLWERHHTRRVTVDWFAQTANKEARILVACTYVMQHIQYPEDWARRWPKYYAAMTAYQRKGRSAHDDAPDATTGLAELIQRGARRRVRIGSKAALGL